MTPDSGGEPLGEEKAQLPLNLTSGTGWGAGHGQKNVRKTKRKLPEKEDKKKRDRGLAQTLKDSKADEQKERAELPREKI